MPPRRVNSDHHPTLTVNQQVFRLLDQVLNFRAAFLTKFVTEGRNKSSFFARRMSFSRRTRRKLAHTGETTKDHSQRGFNKLEPGLVPPQGGLNSVEPTFSVCHTGSYRTNLVSLLCLRGATAATTNLGISHDEDKCRKGKGRKQPNRVRSRARALQRKARPMPKGRKYAYARARTHKPEPKPVPKSRVKPTDTTTSNRLEDGGKEMQEASCCTCIPEHTRLASRRPKEKTTPHAPPPQNRRKAHGNASN